MERKGWSTPKELLEQTEKFVESINGKYIIIGLSDGDENTNKEVDKLLEEKFGDKFINSRNFLWIMPKMIWAKTQQKVTRKK